MAWNPITQPCDYILLSGKKSPGMAVVSGGGASSIRRWDEREGFGISGAFPVFKGRGLARFSVKLKFWTPEHWNDWATWKGLVDKLPRKRFGEAGKDTGNLDIWHPLLEDVDIKSVCVAERMAPEQTADGEWTIDIRFLEFRRPKFTLAKPEGSEATPVDPVEEEIIKPLTEQLQGLVRKLDAPAA